METMSTQGTGERSQQKTTRIIAVDLARILAATSIMYSHIQIWNMNSSLTNCLGGFLMNHVISLDTYNCIFFIFAGYFVSRNITWRKAVRSSLWCAGSYLLWNLIAFCAAYIALGSCPPASSGDTTALGRICSYLGLLGTPPVDGPLWFLRDLTLFFLLSPLIFRVSMWLLAISLFGSIYTVYQSLIDHAFAMEEVCSLYSLSFFSLGCALGKLSASAQQKLLLFYSVPMTCVYFAMVVAAGFSPVFGYSVNMLSSVPNAPFITITISIWMFYQLCRILEEKVPFVPVLTKHIAPLTFLVFALHRIVFSWILPQNILNTNVMLLMPIAVFLVSYVLFVIMKRYCRPLLYVMAHYKTKGEASVAKPGVSR